MGKPERKPSRFGPGEYSVQFAFQSVEFMSKLTRYKKRGFSHRILRMTGQWLQGQRRRWVSQPWQWTPQMTCHLRSHLCLSQMQQRLLLPQTVRTAPEQRNTLSSDCSSCSQRTKMGVIYLAPGYDMSFNLHLLTVGGMLPQQGCSRRGCLCNCCAVRLWFLTNSIILAWYQIISKSKPPGVALAHLTVSYNCQDNGSADSVAICCFRAS